MVSKPKIAGLGLNWQQCADMIFVGLSDSFEQVFQAIRRCYRFGQTRPVHVTMITSSREGAVSENIKRKEADYYKMLSEMIKYTKNIVSANVHGAKRDIDEYHPQIPMIIPDWLNTVNFDYELEGAC